MTTTARRRGKTGRPPITSSAQLLAAALEIGFEHLTIGAVTHLVNVKYSTFYRHYPSLRALVEAAVDARFEQHPFPPARPGWRADLASMAGHLNNLMGRFPGMAEAIGSLRDDDGDQVDPPAITEARARGVAALEAAGLDTDVAEGGMHALAAAATLPPRRASAVHLLLLLDGLQLRLERAA